MTEEKRFVVVIYADYKALPKLQLVKVRAMLEVPMPGDVVVVKPRAEGHEHRFYRVDKRYWLPSGEVALLTNQIKLDDRVALEILKEPGAKTMKLRNDPPSQPKNHA